jgi:hypothetical protein
MPPNFKLSAEGFASGTIIPTPAGESIVVGQNGVAQITTEAAIEWAKKNLGASETDEPLDEGATARPMQPDHNKATEELTHHTTSRRQAHERTT